ncbi:hypothetical protein ACHAWO_010361 [Cyclotella atomus]|uniref:Uncharacterized protein n=1 Tax=Cyclotella atomus TaxID=382360 RepID=A0ABD3N6N7_9STRA
MTYQSRGRSIFEVVLAICFVAFLIGFITVLCIGNYFRAKRAQERQRQRREAKQASQNNNANNMERGMGGKGGGEYEAPTLPQGAGASGRLL